MKRALLALLVAVVCLLHQDFWFWRSARPLLFGFLPVGLWYHALYCLAAAGLLALLVRLAWPARLEEDAERTEHLAAMRAAPEEPGDTQR